MGRLKCQALSRSMIESIHDVVYLCLRQRIQGRAFGHILANQRGIFESCGYGIERPTSVS